MNTNYLNIANDFGMWIASSVIIFIVIYQIYKFIKISFNAGRKLGISEEKMKKAFRVGFTTSIVPSIAILMGLALLVFRLGLPFSWMRLSVNGSVTYELIAAATAANEMGLKGLTGEFNSQVFANAVWTMSLGGMFLILFIAFFTPKIRKLNKKMGKGDMKWLRIMTISTFFGALSYMIGQSMARGNSSLISLITGSIAMGAIGSIIIIFNQRWLKEWALSISVVIGMISTGLAFHFFRIGG